MKTLNFTDEKFRSYFQYILRERRGGNKMSNKAWRIVALLFIVVPIIICIIISFIITYFPTSDVSLILASDFLPIAIKIQGVGILIAILVSIFKIKKD